MKKVLIILVSFILLSSFVSQSLAQSLQQTLVSGTVYDQSSAIVTSGSVSVSCNGHVRGTSIEADGSYGVVYPQSECKSGDLVTVTANTSEGVGSNSGSVQDEISGPIIDLDIAVVDVHTVPEFGLITGMIATLASVGGYLAFKRSIFA